ncbi:MAG TPA: hypothetical protein VHE12_06885 [bacterium]|nr:hypothetical protein [bacterium]
MGPRRTGTKGPRLLFHPWFPFLLAALAVFAPLLFAGQAYFDGDLIAYYVPMRTFLRSSVLSGHLPLWCPYLMGGQPFFADPNTQAAYPLTYFFISFPVPYGFGLFYFVHFLIACLGMYFWTGTLGLSREARILGGLLFAFSGFFWWEIIHPPLLAAYAWLPWWGGALEMFAQKKSRGWAFRGGLVFALLFLAGNFQVTLGALYGGGGYLAFRLWSPERNAPASPGGRGWALSVLYFLWGALPLLILWIPAWEFLGRSQRWNGPTDYGTFQADLSLDPRSLLGVLFPLATLDGSGGKSIQDHLVNAAYLGPASFFLMAVGFRGKGKFPLYLAVTACTALLLSFGRFFPLHRWFCDWVPGFGLMRAPFRYLFLYVTGGTLLAVLGFERLFGGKKGGRDLVPWVFLAYVVLVTVLGFGVHGWNALVQAASLGLGAVALFAFRFALRPWARWAFVLSVLLALMPFAWTGASSRRGPADNFDYQGRSAELRWLDGQAKEGRAIIGNHLPYPVRTGGRTEDRELSPDAACVSRTRIVFGYNPLSLVSITDLYTLPSRTLLRLMAVRCYASADEKRRVRGFSVEDHGPVALGRNLEQTPFVYSPRTSMIVPDAGRCLDLMRGPKFDPRVLSLFSGLPEGAGPIDRKGLAACERSRDDPDDQVFRVRMAGGAPLVFSEIMYPGWKAWLDGKEVPIVTANHAFRALWVPSGEHEVRFRFLPVWAPLLTWGAVLWVLSLLVFGPWRVVKP